MAAAEQPTLFDQPPDDGAYPKQHSARHIEAVKQLQENRLERIREHNHAKLQTRISATFNDRRSE